MDVQDIMTSHVEVVSPDSNVLEAARLMRDRDIGFLPVCDGQRVLGTLTDRDIVIRAIADGLAAQSTACRDIMSRDVNFVFEDQDIEDAASMMEENQIRRLLVLNREKMLVGMVSLGDISRESGDEALAGEISRSVSEERSMESDLH